MITVLFKNCRKCKEEKLPHEFFLSSINDDGLGVYCKECQKILAKEYMTPEKKKRQIEQARKWVVNNPEKFKEYFKKSTALKHNKIRSNLCNTTREKTNIKCPIGIKSKELKTYIETLFTPEMTWDNYGTIWEVRRLKKISEFDLTKESDCLLVNHYLNLKPTLKSELYKT